MLCGGPVGQQLLNVRARYLIDGRTILVLFLTVGPPQKKLHQEVHPSTLYSMVGGFCSAFECMCKASLVM